MKVINKFTLTVTYTVTCTVTYFISKIATATVWSIIYLRFLKCLFDTYKNILRFYHKKKVYMAILNFFKKIKEYYSLYRILLLRLIFSIFDVRRNINGKYNNFFECQRGSW